MSETKVDAATGTGAIDNSLSLADLAGGFMHDGEAEEEATEEVTPAKAEAVTDEPEAETEEDAPRAEPEAEVEDTEEETILDRLAPDGLTEEEATALSVELGSGSGQRIGKLTAEKKALAEQLEMARSELNKKQDVLGNKEEEDNPFQSSNTIEELEEINAAATETVDTWSDILDDSRDAVADEIIGQVGEQDITKAQARAMVKNAKAALRKHLPARLRAIRENESYETARVNNLEAVKQIHPWVADDSDAEKKSAFEAASTELLAEVRKLMPHRLGQIDLMLADHCDASFDRQNARPAARSKAASPVKRKAPSTPGGAGGARSRATGRAAKANKEEQFLNSSGSVEDLTNYFL